MKIKHNGTANFTIEQLWAWVHLIQMGKHSSTVHPPDKPFFHKSKKGTSKSSSSTPHSNPITLRGDCIDQLMKWHDLLDIGAITQAQYEDTKAKILEDTKKC